MNQILPTQKKIRIKRNKRRIRKQMSRIKGTSYAPNVIFLFKQNHCSAST